MGKRKAGSSSEIRVPLATLAADPANPRTMTDEARAGLGVSLETFGELGMVFNDRTCQWVSGHQRLERLQAAGAVECVRNGAEGYIEHPKTGERFRVRFVDWDETKQRMANLVANNPAIGGEFTADAVAMLKELEGEEGFADLALDVLERDLQAELDLLDPPVGGNCDPDDVPEPPVEPLSKLGDLWILGEHRLLCGDSTSAEDVARLMGRERVDTINTDPPYGIAYTGKGISGSARAHDFGSMAGDAGLDTTLRALAVASAIDHDLAIWWGGNYYCAHLTEGKAWIVWDKETVGDVYSQAEVAWTNRSGRTRMFRHQWHGMIKESERKESRVHPTQKPVALAVWALNEFSSGQNVLDLFCGSGWSVLACEQSGRRCFAMELDPRYVDVAVARWEKYTGKKAVRADG